MTTILSEHQSTELPLTRAQAEALARTGFVDVAPSAGESWRVSAGSYVGSLVVDDVELLIRPKVNPENLFLLLEPGLPSSAWRREAFGYAATSDLLPSVIAFFSRTVETVLGRGVLRSYTSRSETLSALRGRLDVPGQLRSAGVLTHVACAYDDFSEDIVENQVLRAAIKLALRVPRVDAVDRRRLMQQLVALESVSDVPVRSDLIDDIPLTRLNQHYAPALGLARLVLANLTLADRRGPVAASSFMVDMNELFQRFVTERLRRKLRGRLDVIDEPLVHLAEQHRVPMLPDLVFRRPGGEICFVADVKYKLTADARARSSDYYQLLAYTTALHLPDGMLIYCRGRDDPRERTVTVRNAGTRLSVRSIDLAGSPERVDAEIADLADAIASTVRSRRRAESV